ncbi:Thioredoxin-like protein AAED1 [Pleurostoma richardsiae]|uniref:Thioredoxin-like protein AAED1 n=1 Tax=Pleurostoma richardsiae TaxID=41990 RepID=A0AA38VWX3_9PEZI|nr:Thioredoxin-like protein AAED1 [Pleurostoma richardsiae]
MAASSDPATEPAKSEPEPSTTPSAAPPDVGTVAPQASAVRASAAMTTTTSTPAKDEKTQAEEPDAAGQASSAHDDEVNPPDFHGEVLTNDELPSVETLRRIKDYVVLDKHGKTHTFKSLYSGRNVARRVLIIFVRHFYCGNCQEYLRTLSASISPEALLALPISTFIAVVGCGDPALIDMYAAATGCPFPVYADPTRRLYSELGMVKSLALGSRPAYMRKSLLKSSLESVVQGLKQLGSGLATKGGDQRQIGGEFLFEPLSVLTPEPREGTDRQLGSMSSEAVGGGAGVDGDEEREVEEKRVTWCHRMRTTRDHAEIPELMEVLGLDGQGQPAKDKKRWSKALETRKGTGLSLAREMGQMKADAGA